MNPLFSPQSLLLAALAILLLWGLPGLVATRLLSAQGRLPRGPFSRLLPSAGLPLLLFALWPRAGQPRTGQSRAGQPSSEADSTTDCNSTPSSWHWRVTGVAVLSIDLLLLAGVGVFPQRAWPLLWPSQEGFRAEAAAQMRATASNWFVAHPAFANHRDQFGVPEVVALSPIVFDPHAGQWTGEALVRHQQGDESLAFTLIPSETQTLEFDLRLGLPPVTASRVLSQLQAALSAADRFQSHGDGGEEIQILKVSGLPYDPRQQHREGCVQVRHGEREEELLFVMRYGDPSQSLLNIQVDESELPTLQSPEVRLLLLQILEGTPSLANRGAPPVTCELVLVAETSTDPIAARRWGKAVVKSPAGLTEVRFTLQWRNRAQKHLRLLIDPPVSPEFDPTAPTVPGQPLGGLAILPPEPAPTVSLPLAVSVKD